MLGKKKNVQARFWACSKKFAKGRQVRDNTRIQYTKSNEKPRRAASGGLEPMSCHHLVEPEEAVEVLALIRVLASLEGLSERLPKLDSAGSAEVILVLRYTDFDGGDGAQIEVVPKKHLRARGPERSVGLP